MTTKMQQIQTYINHNVNNLTKLDMLEFFNNIHTNYYNELDISFMSYFLSLCRKEHEFCVEQENAQSNNIKRTLTEQLFFSRR